MEQARARRPPQMSRINFWSGKFAERPFLAHSAPGAGWGFPRGDSPLEVSGSNEYRAFSARHLGIAKLAIYDLAKDLFRRAQPR
jgi:hypothetical protein